MARKVKPAKKIVMIGHGMATMASLEAIFKHEAILENKKQVEITIFGGEARRHYNRILLSNVLSGKTEFEKIIPYPIEWYQERGINLRQGVSVIAIDVEKRMVTDSEGEVSPYDACLLATGASPSLPPIDGNDKEGVFTFWTIEDTEKILSAASQHLEAVIIGGGLLGLEAARALINYGVSVTVIQLADQLMEQQIDWTGAALLKEEIERMGIRVLLETKVDAILGDESVSAVRLSSGEVLPTGIVLICVGSRPNIALAEETAAEVNRGVIVDDRMETSLPGLFAMGDMVEHRGRCYGLIAPLKRQAEVLADVMVGKGRLRYEGTCFSTTLKVPGVSLTSAGILTKGRGGEELSFLDSARGIYKKCVIHQNRLVGFILLGEYEEGLGLFNLLQSGRDVSAIKHQLLGKTGTAETVERVSEISTLSDSDIICNCNHITKGEIVGTICEKELNSWEEVARCTQAATGCGSCVQLLDDLLLETKQHKKQNDLIYPSRRTIEVGAIKQEGLGVDFTRISREGSLAVSPEDEFRLRTYGISPQKHAGYSMFRIRIPGGRLSSEQLVGLAGLAEIHGRGRMHLTTRQALELHWFRVEEAEVLFESLREMGLTSRSSCGHTFPNIMACPHGEVGIDGVIDVQSQAAQVSDWVLKCADLMNTVMPNRLNVAFSGCPACDGGASINDIGFVAVYRKNKSGQNETGYALWVGGSVGQDPMPGFLLRSFISLEDALPACQAIFSIYTRFASQDPTASRLKYLIQRWGQEKFSRQFDSVFTTKQGNPENRGFSAITTETAEISRGWIAGLRMRKPSQHADFPPGVKAQRQTGLVQVALEIPLGEIRSEIMTALGEIAKRFGDNTLYFTKDQNIELHGIGIGKITGLRKALKESGLSLKGETVHPKLLACVGIEFCPLAVTHAQGAARELLDHYSPLGSEKQALLQSISIHISGCRNSCTKHQLADIGLVGEMLPVGDARRYSYQLFLGGSLEGEIRMGVAVMKGITETMVLPLVDTLLNIVLIHRQEGEHFQRAIVRLGTTRIAALLESKMSPVMKEAFEEVNMVTTKLEAVL